MLNASEYRQHGTECTDFARLEVNLEAKAVWTEMAISWFRLAVQRDLLDDSREAQLPHAAYKAVVHQTTGNVA